MTDETKHTQAWIDVAEERSRQIASEGWTYDHDDKHERGEMAVAAACYALYTKLRFTGGTWLSDIIFRLWPWSTDWWKPTDARRNLVKAAALILAEIERLDRKEGRSK